MRSVIEMSWPQIQLLNRSSTVIIMPIASVEQHGKHLPVGTDYLLLQKIVQSLREFEVEGYKGILLPSLQFGLNSEHIAFSGTISLGEQCITEILCKQADTFVRDGFKNFILLNSHGGNAGLIDSFIRSYLPHSHGLPHGDDRLF